MSQSKPTSKPGFTWAQIGAGSVGAGALAYLVYRAYNGPEPKWLTSLTSAANALASMSSSSALLARDLHAFLQSESEELPPSLRQLNRLLQSEEVRHTLSTAAQALMRGAVAASNVTGGGGDSTAGGQQQAGVVDKVLEAILSDRGRSLVGMAMGLATKNATSTLCEFIKAQQQERAAAASAGGAAQQQPTALLSSVFQLLSSEQGERLLSLLITKSMKTAVSAYVEATAGYNTYEDFLSSIAKQDHRDAVSDIMSRVTACFCREVACALQLASHSSSNSSSRRTSSSPKGTHITHTRPSRTPPHHCPPPSTLTPSSSLSSAASSTASLSPHQHPHTLTSQHTPHVLHPPAPQTLFSASASVSPSPQHSPQQHTATAHSEHTAAADASTSSTQQRGSGECTNHFVLTPPDEVGQGELPGSLQDSSLCVGGSEQQQQHGTQQQQQHDLQGSVTTAVCGVGSLSLQSAFASLGGATASALALSQQEPLVHSSSHQPSSSAPTHSHNQHQHQQHQHNHQQHLHHNQHHDTAVTVSSPVKPFWVKRVVELAREKEVRALCLDVVTSATREATRSTMEVVSVSVRANLPTYVEGLGLSQLTSQQVVFALLAVCLAFFVWCIGFR